MKNGKWDTETDEENDNLLTRRRDRTAKNECLIDILTATLYPRRVYWWVFDY